ncbi:MAG: AAA family ATPase [Bacteroidota bacterium]|nr:AAA family ATPase [Bacteroidota bacterium]
MLTRLRVKNFKRFDDVDIELGKNVVLIGPNNSGKSTALQALALWYIGVRKWNELRVGKSSPERRPGVTINRNDLISIPVPAANLLWRDLHVRDAEMIDGKQQTKNVRIDIIVSGITNSKSWECGLEFDYANPESFYCRALRLDDKKQPSRMTIPQSAPDIQIAFLPPMSGLAASEPKWEQGRINVLLGEGQTAQVLRNLCFQIFEKQKTENGWSELKAHILNLFGVILLEPQYIKERGEITMAYKESSGVQLDLSSSGRGLQQTLLLLAHLFANKGTVLLLDEPDAHLEILRQRQIYQLLTSVADRHNSQIIAASHSEVVLNEAAGRDTVIAFIGKPHLIIDRGSQLLKALTDIGFDQYYQAELKGWILYVEGPSDLAILKELASILKHESVKYLDDVFVHYVATNLPQRARDHFNGLREAKQNLVGVAIFDRLDKKLQTGTPLFETMWMKNEIENYLCNEKILLSYARYGVDRDDLFGNAEAERRIQVMEESIAEISVAVQTLYSYNPWSSEIKASEQFLDPLFKLYFKKLQLPNIMNKSNYYELAKFADPKDITDEIKQKLDIIVEIAKKVNLV